MALRKKTASKKVAGQQKRIRKVPARGKKTAFLAAKASRKKKSRAKIQKKRPSPALGKKLDLTVQDEGVLPRFSSSPKDSAPKSFEPEPKMPKQGASLRLQTQSGIDKAARFLLAIGPQQAAFILKELEESEVEKLMKAMLQIKQISAEEKKAILADFQKSVDGFEAPVQGGLKEAEKMLELGLGTEKAREILGRVKQKDLFKDFAFLERIDTAILASSLAQEHAQITAVALSYLNPRTAAHVMKALPESYRAEVAMRIARTTRINPEAIQNVARVLREKFEKRIQEQFSEVGGANSLANILNHMDRNQEDEILQVLGKAEPEILEEVKEKLYTFEELISLTQKEMRTLIARVSDDELLSRALRGADDELKRHFFGGMSQNRAADILDEMELRGPLTVREINEARAFILNTARKLDDEGLIVIKKTKEEYV